MTTNEQEATEAAASTLRRDVALVRPLTGGQHATILMVTDGNSHYVVRTFPPHDDAAAREAAILERLRPLDALVPRLIAHNEDPERQVIVTTAIPGTTPAPDLPARTIASQMAAALARVHQLDGTGLRPAPAGLPAANPTSPRAPGATGTAST